jgi:hypothetical protein
MVFVREPEVSNGLAYRSTTDVDKITAGGMTTIIPVELHLKLN